MATGASTADLAVILVDARKGRSADADAPPHATSSRCSASATSCSPSTRWIWSAIDRRSSTRSPRDYRAFAEAARLPRRRSPSRSRRCAATMSSSRARACPGTAADRCCVPRNRRRRRGARERSRSACRCNGSTAPTRISAALPARIASGAVAAGRRASWSLPSGRRAASRASSPPTAICDRPRAGDSRSRSCSTDEIDVSRGDVFAPPTRRPRSPISSPPSCLDGRASRCCPAAPIC